MHRLRKPGGEETIRWGTDRVATVERNIEPEVGPHGVVLVTELEDDEAIAAERAAACDRLPEQPTAGTSEPVRHALTPCTGQE